MDITTRLRLPYPDGADGPDGPDVPHWMRALAVDLDEKMLAYDVGVFAARPAAGIEGRMYYATDDGTAWFDTGTGWVPFAWAPGDLRWTASRDAPPVGWLVCDGSTVSRTSYSALFAAVGTTWGLGDGRTTFGLPPADRVPLGATSARPVGATGGAEQHALTIGQMPPHAHGIPHGVVNAFAGPPYYSPAGSGQGNLVYQSQSTASAGSGQPHNNMQPWMSCQLLIKT